MAFQMCVALNVLNNCKTNVTNIYKNLPFKCCTQFYATTLTNRKLFFRNSCTVRTINQINIDNSNNIIDTEIMSQKRFFHDANIVSK